MKLPELAATTRAPVASAVHCSSPFGALRQAPWRGQLQARHGSTISDGNPLRELMSVTLLCRALWQPDLAQSPAPAHAVSSVSEAVRSTTLRELARSEPSSTEYGWTAVYGSSQPRLSLPALWCWQALKSMPRTSRLECTQLETVACHQPCRQQGGTRPCIYACSPCRL